MKWIKFFFENPFSTFLPSSHTFTNNAFDGKNLFKTWILRSRFKTVIFKARAFTYALKEVMQYKESKHYTMNQPKSNFYVNVCKRHHHQCEFENTLKVIFQYTI